MSFTPAEQRYLDAVKASQPKRMKWWHDARFGMFVHWGLYSLIGRHEWVMNRERMPREQYQSYADQFKPKPRAARAWAKLARDAGMKYMVLTTKHHEGFCLWDSQANPDYNAVSRGPKRDLVAEYVDAAREYGLKVGFYYSLMDWHHPDGHRCATDEAARVRFTQYTQDLVRELMSNYGKIDILWYDVSWPLSTPQQWDSFTLNQMVRKLQPHILMNDRSQLPEDFGTPEEHITAASAGRAWEACMTFNGAWGWQWTPPEDWHSVRKVIDMLRQVTAGSGNLLLNIGPQPDGSVPAEATERLTKVGRWLKQYGSVIYGHVDRMETTEWMNTGQWTRRGNTAYFWCTRWPGKELAIGGLRSKLKQFRLVGQSRTLKFTQEVDRLVVHGLPETCPDKVAHVAVFEMNFAGLPQQLLGAGYEPAAGQCVSGKWFSPPVPQWQVSKLFTRSNSSQTVADMPAVKLKDALDWHSVTESVLPGLINFHAHYAAKDGLVYLGNRFDFPVSGKWTLHFSHDGGINVWVDGQPVFCDPQRRNPVIIGRSKAEIELKKGNHEIIICFDTDQGHGWGVATNFEVPADARKGKPQFPKLRD